MALLKSSAREALNAINRTLGRRRLQLRLREQEKVGTSLEISANETARLGWIATDVAWRCKNYLDVTKAWPMDSDSINNIFSDNVIEHLSLDSNRFFFREAFRTLKTGGSIRLVTPNIGALVENYKTGLSNNVELVNQLISEDYLIAHSVDLLRFAFQDDGHHSGYLWDQESLFMELDQAGFTGIRRYDLGVSENPEFTGTDSRVGLPIAEVMLAVEATKCS